MPQGLVISSCTMNSLQVHDGTTYYIATFDPGGQTWRREYARSPFMHGAVPIGQVKDIVEMTFGIYCCGSSIQAAQDAVDALIAAVYEFEYTTTIVMGGDTRSWTCWAADAFPGLQEDDKVRGKKILTRLQVPRQAVPLTGGF